jgi:hypothetical protein
MTGNVRNTGTNRAPMDAMRKTALAGGLFYLITFLASIPALGLLDPVLHNTHFILGAGSENRVLWGVLLDVINAFAGIGTAVALFPVMKRWSESFALGFVTSRVLEAATIVCGVVSLLAVVTLRQDLAGATGADAGTLVTIGRSLVAVRDWTFLLGPGLMPVVSAALLGTLMYRSRLVPRVIPVMGLIGAPLLLASTTATLFGIFGQTSSAGIVLGLPLATWELSLGLWLTFKGFKRSSLPTGSTTAGAPSAYSHAAA